MTQIYKIKTNNDRIDKAFNDSLTSVQIDIFYNFIEDYCLNGELNYFSLKWVINEIEALKN